MEALRKLEAAAESIRSMPSDEETADYLGRLDFVIRKLTDHKRAVLSETPGPIAGKDYRVIESRYADRSYNTAGLLYSFATQQVAVQDLVRSGVVRLSWQWTKLTRALTDAGLKLTTIPREIEDLGQIDGPLVGEVWKSRLSIEAVDK